MKVLHLTVTAPVLFLNQHLLLLVKQVMPPRTFHLPAALVQETSLKTMNPRAPRAPLLKVTVLQTMQPTIKNQLVQILQLMRSTNSHPQTTLNLMKVLPQVLAAPARLPSQQQMERTQQV